MNQNKFILSISSKLAVNMTGEGSIKLFQFIQKYFRAIGVRGTETNQINRSFFNLKNLIFISSAAPMLISTSTFLLYEAETTYDFGLSTYYLICLIFTGIYYIIYIWQIGNIFKFIENCETFVGQSKLNNKVFSAIKFELHKIGP